MTIDPSVLAIGASIVSLLSGGGIGAAATKMVEWKKAANDGRKIDVDAKAEHESVLVAGLTKLIDTLQTQAAQTEKRGDAARAAEDAARAAHRECMDEVQEAIGRIELLEVNATKTGLALDDCQKQHREALAARAHDAAVAAAEMQVVRERLAKLSA